MVNIAVVTIMAGNFGVEKPSIWINLDEWVVV
jgi:hypothetical protein